MELKSESHHWWPKCVSDRWKDEEGCVNWLLPDGEVRRAPPKNFGVIGNAHHVKLGASPDKATVWDHSFEEAFDRADSYFPSVIDWLDGLEREDRPDAENISDRFHTQEAPEDMLSHLVEGLVSLAVRSPMNREAAASLAEHLRGPLPAQERNAIIGLNMGHCQRMVVDSVGTRGKFAILYSPGCEFIFGDGFFHNIDSPSQAPMNPKIVAPITPHISAVYAIPIAYSIEPRLSTLVLSVEEATALNDSVQLYACNALFYRMQKPVVLDEFKQGQHLHYSDTDNSIDSLIHSLPGVPPRDTSLDRQFEDRRDDSP